MTRTRLERDDGLAVLTLDNPPLNQISGEVVDDLIAAVDIGMVLIPPVALKLGSTGYRFARYYLGSPVYRAKGPPLLPLRLLAPVLVLTTLLVFATGVWLPDHRVEMTASHAGSIPSPRCASGSAPGLRTAYLRARLIARGLVSTRGTACAARR